MLPSLLAALLGAPGTAIAQTAPTPIQGGAASGGPQTGGPQTGGPQAGGAHTGGASLAPAPASAPPPAPAAAPAAAPAQATAPAAKPAEPAIKVDPATLSLDRVQMKDSGMSCPQIKGEVDALDTIEKDARAKAGGTGELSNAATANAAGNVARGAAAASGSFGGMGLFGGLAQLGTQLAMDSSAKDARTNAERAQAAKARKELLVELFIKRDCKL